jgi:hypothetical protein
MSEVELRTIASNYEWCSNRQIFGAIVGREILWPFATTQKAHRYYLKYGVVTEYHAWTTTYVLQFRDGSHLDIQPEILDAAITRHDDILAGDETSFTLNEDSPVMVSFTALHIHHAVCEKKAFPSHIPGTPDDTPKLTTDSNANEEASNDVTDAEACANDETPLGTGTPLQTVPHVTVEIPDCKGIFM